MSEILGSASLLVAVAGLIYSVWYGEIKAALEISVPAYGRAPLKKQVSAALWYRSLPITAVVVALTLALAPPALQVLQTAFKAVSSGDAHYDAVAACFLIVFLSLIVLTLACARDLFRLGGLHCRLKEPSESPE